MESNGVSWNKLIWRIENTKFRNFALKMKYPPPGVEFQLKYRITYDIYEKILFSCILKHTYLFGISSTIYSYNIITKQLKHSQIPPKIDWKTDSTSKCSHDIVPIEDCDAFTILISGEDVKPPGEEDTYSQSWRLLRYDINLNLEYIFDYPILCKSPSDRPYKVHWVLGRYYLTTCADCVITVDPYDSHYVTIHDFKNDELEMDVEHRTPCFNQLILSRNWSQLMMCELKMNSPDVRHHKILSLDARTLKVKKTYKWLKDGGTLDNLVECAEESWLITLSFCTGISSDERNTRIEFIWLHDGTVLARYVNREIDILHCYNPFWALVFEPKDDPNELNVFGYISREGRKEELKLMSLLDGSICELAISSVYYIERICQEQHSEQNENGYLLQNCLDKNCILWLSHVLFVPASHFLSGGIPTIGIDVFWKFV